MTESDMISAIGRVIDLNARLGRADLQDDVAEIQDRLERSILSVALIGQFKRGKISLLNVLLQDAILPTGVLPLTAIVTRVRWGPEIHAVVRLLDGSEREIPLQEIRLYATEADHAKNVRGIRDILLLHSAPILHKGIELVDMPGIGLVWEHNAQIATRYLPWVDIALFVVSPDPPTTNVERQFLQEAQDHAGEILVILTNSDLLAPEDLVPVSSFLLEVAEAALGTRVPLFTTLVVLGGLSSVDEITSRLVALTRNEHEVMAATMATRRVLGVLRRLPFEFELQRAAVTTSLEMRAQRHAALRRQLSHHHVIVNGRLSRLRPGHHSMPEINRYPRIPAAN